MVCVPGFHRVVCSTKEEMQLQGATAVRLRRHDQSTELWTESVESLSTLKKWQNRKLSSWEEKQQNL